MSASAPDRGQLISRLAAVAAGARHARRLLTDGDDACGDYLATLTSADHASLERTADQLLARGARLLTPRDAAWPTRVGILSSPPAYLFCWGNLELLEQRSVGMCGARSASDRGLAAASDCGALVADQGWHVISGYARGVDSATHHGSLRAGAGTVIVLAEGILHFRRKRFFDDVPFDEQTVLAVSQFPPSQRWTAGGAMTRNGLIVTLGNALVVIEAGERGGTLAAGQQALSLGRPVLALEYADGSRPGNAQLISAGAHAIATRGQLREALRALNGSELVARQDEMASHAVACRRGC